MCPLLRFKKKILLIINKNNNILVLEAHITMKNWNSKFRNAGRNLPLLHQKTHQVQLHLLHLGFLSELHYQSNGQRTDPEADSPLNVAEWAAGKLLVSDKAAVSAPWPEQKSSPLLARRPACSLSHPVLTALTFFCGRRCNDHKSLKQSIVLVFFPLKKVKKITYHFAESSCSYILPLFYKEIS